MLNFSVDEGMTTKAGKRTGYMEKIKRNNNEIKIADGLTYRRLTSTIVDVPHC